MYLNHPAWLLCVCVFRCRRCGQSSPNIFLLLGLLFGPATTGDKWVRDTIVSSKVGWKGGRSEGEKQEEEKEDGMDDTDVMGLDESVEVERGWLLF